MSFPVGYYKHSDKVKRKIKENSARFWLGKKRPDMGKKLKKAHKGKHYSPKTEFKKGHFQLLNKEWKEKIGKSNKISLKKFWQSLSPKEKKIRTERLRNCIPYNKGKIGYKNKGTFGVGGKHPMWKGGISSLREKIWQSESFKLWRKAIFERDIWTCRECSQKGGNLQPHHLKSFSNILKEYKIGTLEEAINCKELWDVNNGITQCKKCHKKKGKHKNQWNFKLDYGRNQVAQKVI